MPGLVVGMVAVGDAARFPHPYLASPLPPPSGSTVAAISAILIRRSPRKPPEDEREIKRDDEIKRLPADEQAAQVGRAQAAAAIRLGAKGRRNHLQLVPSLCNLSLLKPRPPALPSSHSCARSGCT